MWKSIVLCVSLFGGAALGLAVGARFVQPGALPAAAAIGLCLIGVVLILAAPANDTNAATIDATDTTREPATVEPIELPTTAMPAASTVTNRTPPMPFQALQH